MLLPPCRYASCYANRSSLPTQSFTQPVTHKLRKLMRRLQGTSPRLIMFGSGLESVPLVKTMLWQPQSPYQPTGLFPGKDGTPNSKPSLSSILNSCAFVSTFINIFISFFTGVGSGVRICHRNTPINLVTLYTATK